MKKTSVATLPDFSGKFAGARRDEREPMPIYGEGLKDGVRLSSGIKKITDRVKPSGWRLLVSLPQISNKTAGGIYKPEETTQIERMASVLGQVLAIGPDAYADPGKFPHGPWCKVGDWIAMQSFSGIRVSVDGEEYRLINDDTVQAVVDGPEGVKRT